MGRIISMTAKEVKATPFTAEEKAMMKKLEKVEPTPDDELPALTPEQLRSFKRVAINNSRARKKQQVTIRLSPSALNRAKSLGKGYSSVLRRILEDTLSNPDSLKRYL